MTSASYSSFNVWLVAGVAYFVAGVMAGIYSDDMRRSARDDFFKNKSWIVMTASFFDTRKDTSNARFWIFFLIIWMFWPFAPTALWVLWWVCRNLGLKNF